MAASSAASVLLLLLLLLLPWLVVARAGELLLAVARTVWLGAPTAHVYRR